jgi:hypothetical protein
LKEQQGSHPLQFSAALLQYHANSLHKKQAVSLSLSGFNPMLPSTVLGNTCAGRSLAMLANRPTQALQAEALTHHE